MDVAQTDTPSGQQRHSLVIGGTGMLADASIWIASRSTVTSLLARRAEGLSRVRDAAGMLGARVVPIQTDYRRLNKFSALLRDSMVTWGPVDLVLCWMRSNADESLHTLLSELGPNPYRFFHVVGSSPPGQPHRWQERLSAIPELTYRKVQLGFIREPTGARWLTHDEISNGVIRAIETDREESLVGQLEPWSSRPAL